MEILLYYLNIIDIYHNNIYCIRINLLIFKFKNIDDFNISDHLYIAISVVSLILLIQRYFACKISNFPKADSKEKLILLLEEISARILFRKA